jgi:hypothetical protein
MSSIRLPVCFWIVPLILETEEAPPNRISRSPRRSAIAPILEKRLQLLQQQGQVGLNRFPNDLEIDIAVIMNHAVAHTDDLAERNVAELGGRLGREARGGLTRDEKAAKDGVLRLGVLQEILVRLTGDLRLDGQGRLVDVEQVDDLSRRYRCHGSIRG